MDNYPGRTDSVPVSDRSTWTRDKLESAARERGVPGVEFLTRTELLRLLGETKPEKAGPVAFARSLLRSFLEKNFPAETAPARSVSELGHSETAATGNAESVAAHHHAESLGDDSASVSTSHSLSDSAPEEPIQTRTMARLLASQGHRDRALKIYDHLLQLHPDDASLREERNEFAEAGTLLEDAQYATDHIDVARTHASSLYVRWELTQNGVRRAAAICEGEPELVVRVVTHEVDEDAQILRDVRDLAADGKVGERLVAPVGERSVCVVAVGVGLGAHFVSIAHTRAPLPPSLEATSIFDGR